MAQPTTLHWYPFFVADWRRSKDVRAMTIEQRGLYRELLDEQWEAGSLPGDEEVLARLVSATPREWTRAWPVVRPKFNERDGRLVNLRLEEIRRQQETTAATNRARASRAASTRWSDAPSIPPSNAPSSAPRIASSNAPSTTPSNAPRNAPIARDLQSTENPERTSQADRPGALRGMESEETQSPAGAKSTGPDGPAYARPSKVRTRPPEPVGFATLVELAKAQRRAHPDADRGDLLEHCKAFCAASGLAYDSTVLHKALDAVERTEGAPA